MSPLMGPPDAKGLPQMPPQSCSNHTALSSWPPKRTELPNRREKSSEGGS